MLGRHFVVHSQLSVGRSGAMLDPLMDGVALTPWNALLEHWGSKKLRNINARWSEKATLDKVVQVGLRSRRGTAIALA